MGLFVLGNKGGRQTVISRMIGETISSPSRDRLVMNAGTRFETSWQFDGANFSHMRGRAK